MHARHKNSTPVHTHTHTHTHTEKNLDMVLAISSENNFLEFAVHSDVEFHQVKCLGKPVRMLHEQYMDKFLYGGGGGGGCAQKGCLG